MLEVRDVAVSFGATVALSGIDLRVADGEIVAVLGPSGSGKSTLLRVVAGLQDPDTGTVAWDGADLAGVAPHRRRFGMVFQDYALFPHLDVIGNVAFGPRMQGLDSGRQHDLARAALERVELAGFERRSISTLSGGQAQRVALARAFAAGPRMLLLDEPLGSLDRALRDRLILELRLILAEPDITALYVTHDQAEAFAVADRVAVVIDGAIEQLAPPHRVWHRPGSESVARLLGFRNIIDARASEGTADTPIGRVPLPPGTRDGPLRLVVRPDAFSVDSDGSVSGETTSVTFRGSDSVVVLATAGGPIEATLADPPRVGQSVTLRVDPDGVAPLPARPGPKVSG